MNLRWSWDAQTRDLFRWVDPDAWDATVHDPVRLLGPGAPRAARRPGRGRRLHALPRRGARGAPALPRRRPLVPGPRGLARCARSPTSPPSSASPRPSPSTRAASACWPATTSRRPATSACRSSASASSTATATSASRCRPTAGSRSATPTSTPTPWRSRRATTSASRSTWPARRSWPGCGRPRSAASRCTCSTPTSTRTRPTSAAITDRLYGGDTEHRLRQEILLGIGGVRALDALGIDAQVFHTNEGHAGFLGLERIRQLVKDPGLSYREAIEAVRAGCIFTTHTPVPAGIDRFPRELIERYFAGWAVRGRHHPRRAHGPRPPPGRRAATSASTWP